MVTFLGWTLVLCIGAVICAVTLGELHTLYLQWLVKLKRAERRVRYIKARSELDMMKLEARAKEEVK